MLFEEFQDDRNLGYRNGTILAILNLCNAPMPPASFGSSRLMVLKEMSFEELQDDPLWQPSWILERNDLSNSESLCHLDASHQVLAQSDLWFGRCCLKNFKIVAMAAMLDIGME